MFCAISEYMDTDFYIAWALSLGTLLMNQVFKDDSQMHSILKKTKQLPGWTQ